HKRVDARIRRGPGIHTPQHWGYGFRVRGFQPRPGMTRKSDPIISQPSVIAPVLCRGAGDACLLTFALPVREAERRETRRLARPPERLAKPPDTLARRAAPACDRGSAPLGAPPAAVSVPRRRASRRRTERSSRP